MRGLTLTWPVIPKDLRRTSIGTQDSSMERFSSSISSRPLSTAILSLMKYSGTLVVVLAVPSLQLLWLTLNSKLVRA